MKLQSKITIRTQEAKTKKTQVDKVSGDGFCGECLKNCRPNKALYRRQNFPVRSQR